MHRKTLATALAAATAASLLIAPQAQASTFATQDISWQKCYPTPQPGLPPGGERLECARFTAPMDWHNPDNGKTVTIAVSRLTPANGTAKSTLFINPGGPGVAGRTMPLVYVGRPKLSENTELIGIDVRGTGGSDNVTCGGYDSWGITDPRDRSKANLDVLYQSMEKHAKECQTKSGELGRYVTTEQTVRDLDLLRQLLGRQKVSWLGYSAGTWLGAHYATYFPKTLDRIVLDSNAEFTAPWQKVFSSGTWGSGFERRFRVDFLPWVAKYDDVYHLGKTAEDVRQAYERTRAKLAEHPVTLPEGVYHPVTLDAVMQGAQYSKYSFDSAARKLAELAGAVPAQMNTQASYPDARTSTGYAIACNDTPFHGGRRFLAHEAAVTGAKWPLLGYYQLLGPCAWWDRPNVDLKRPTGIGVVPTLMVQSERDAATPIEGARRAHQGFRNSVLLTVENEGDHSIYGRGNECVADIVESYLVDGVVPARDLTCQGMPLPEPGQAGTDPLAEARRFTTQLGW